MSKSSCPDLLGISLPQPKCLPKKSQSKWTPGPTTLYHMIWHIFISVLFSCSHTLMHSHTCTHKSQNRLFFLHGVSFYFIAFMSELQGSKNTCPPRRHSNKRMHAETADSLSSSGGLCLVPDPTAECCSLILLFCSA